MKKTAKQTFMDKIVNAGGDYIANRVMLKPGLDRMRGQEADEKRMQLIRNRERRLNSRMFGK